MRRSLLPLAAALALASQAHAFSYFSVGALSGPSPGDPGSSMGQTAVITFNSGTASGVLPASGVTTSIGGGITERLSGAVGLYTGNAYGGGYQIAAAPAGDRTQYEAIGTGGSVLFNFSGYKTAHAIRSLSLYIGSIDPYNTLQFYNTSGGLISTITGSDLPSDTGDQGASITNRRAYFTFAPGDDFTTLVLSSSGVAFEYDTIAVGAASFANLAEGATPLLTPTPSSVPEPAGWALMILGVGLVGGALRRRTGVRRAI